MKESYSSSKEILDNHEAVSSVEHSVGQTKPEQNHHSAETHAAKKSFEKEARQEVYKHTISAEKHKDEQSKIKESQPSAETSHHYLTKAIKEGTYRHTLARVQTGLSKQERRFSKIIHNKTVEKASEVGSKTVARPNAILGGGALMLVAGLTTLLVAKNYGFELPLSVYISLYVVGFALVATLELISASLLKRSKKRKSSN